MIATVQPYRLKVRVPSGAEFDAEGPEESVQAQFDLFLRAIESCSGNGKNHKAVPEQADN